MNKNRKGAAGRTPGIKIDPQQNFYLILDAIVKFSAKENNVSHEDLMNWLLGYVFLHLVESGNMTMEEIDFFVPIFLNDKCVPRKLRKEYLAKKDPLLLLRERTADNRKELKRQATVAKHRKGRPMCRPARA